MWKILSQPLISPSFFHRLQWTQLRALADPVQKVLAQASETHFSSAADLRYAHQMRGQSLNTAAICSIVIRFHRKRVLVEYQRHSYCAQQRPFYS
jgi:hypothetical protein